MCNAAKLCHLAQFHLHVPDMLYTEIGKAWLKECAAPGGKLD